MSVKLTDIINKLSDKEKILVKLISGNGLGIDYNDKYIKTVLGLSEKKYQNFKLNTFNKIKKELV
jgi:DNA-directed RNA polymerase specialized sigma subunit